jgi:hypothetical protein
MGSVTVAPVNTAGSRIWTCDDCGQRFTWTSASYWFGSYKDLDEGNWSTVQVYCGCRPMPEGERVREVEM